MPNWAPSRALFTFDGIVNTLVEKLIRRHPHVFADGAIEGVVDSATTVAEVNESWETIKQQERNARAQTSALADIPLACRLYPGRKSCKSGPPGVSLTGVTLPVRWTSSKKKLRELRRAMQADASAEIAEEMGDVLFSCVNLARHLGLDAEASLRGASRKFEARFRAMEAAANESGRQFESWQRTKWMRSGRRQSLA